ncbi:MAG TPA: MFS transporter [Kribbella sp.]
MQTSVLRNRNFRLLWAGSAISGVGSWLLVVAIPFHVFQLTGSAAATGLTLASEALPALLVGPWAGVLLDRWNLSRAMWLADLASAAAVAFILLADSADRVWLVYVAVLAENFATTVFRPAARALTPSVVGTGSQLAGANAFNALSGSVLRLAAPPLGALLLAGPGIQAVLVVDIASYLLSAALVAAVSRRIAVPPASPNRARPLDDLKAGFRYVAMSPTLRGLLAGNGVFLTANAGLTALLVPLAVERLNAPGYTVGYLISGLGAGTLLGASISAKALTCLGIRNLASITQLATSLAFFALVNAPGLTAAVGAAVLIGIPGSLLMISIETTLQRVSAQELLGRIGALFFAVDSLALIIGALGAPALVALLGLGPGLNLLSAFALVAAPVTLLAVPSAEPGRTSRGP